MEQTYLSVIVTTFNQQYFVSDCINSIITQKTNFEYEILIGDDKSTDDTQLILKDFEKKNKNIKNFFWKKNEGGLKNINKLLQKASGKYVVILEGDDFWTDKNFLQHSINFLEHNNKFSFVSSNYVNLKNNNFIKNKTQSGCVSAKSLSLGNFIKMGSTVFEKKYYPEVDKNFINLPLGDYPLLMSLLNHKKGFLRKNVSLAYRIHHGGIWSKKDKIYIFNSTIITIQKMKELFKKNLYFNLQINYLKLKILIFKKDIQKINFLSIKTLILGIICYEMIKIRDIKLSSK